MSMGLFQKKVLPITVPKYSIGNQETKLIVGLGNIGKEYLLTRHNIGFLCVDDFAAREEFNPWVEKKDLKAILCAKIMDGKKVILCKPTTMMNLSGEAILAVQNFYKIDDASTCIMYDELDLTLGIIRTGQGGSSAGHNGIKSLINHTENKGWRLRIGIGPKNPEQMDTADFVLQKFTKEQQEKLLKIKKEAMNLLNDWLSGQAKADTRKVL
jgi:PTH1 family peptidyl-tRNA hydrolase